MWTHEAVVIIPKNLVYTNVSTLYMASASSGCNNDKPINGTNLDVEMADVIADNTHHITVALF